MQNSIKRKFIHLSLSKEYFIYSSVILLVIFIVSIFLYSYNYSLYTNIKNKELVKSTKLVHQAIEARWGDIPIQESHLKKMGESLEKIAVEHSTSVILIDRKCHVLWQSKDVPLQIVTHFCDTQDLNAIKGLEGFLPDLFQNNEINYPYYKKVKNTPFFIFSGFNKKTLESNIHQEILPKLYGFILMGIFCTIILYFFRRRIITPLSILATKAMLIARGETDIQIPKQSSIEMFHLAKALILVKHYIKRNQRYREKLEAAHETIKISNEAREDFMKSMNQEITSPLKEIVVYSEILLKEIIESVNDEHFIKRALQGIEKIREAAENIKLKTSSSLNLTSFCMSDIVTQAVQINLKQSLSKKVPLQVEFSEKIPMMHGDPLKLKQIMVELILQSIENSSENQTILISVKNIQENHLNLIQVTIKDNSFGLSEEALLEIQKNVGWHDNTNLFAKIDPHFIEKIVQLHSGKIEYENKLYAGRTTTLCFPLLEAADFLMKKPADNLYYLYPPQNI